VIKDEALLEIAAHPPLTLAEMGKMRSVTSGFADGKLGGSLLAAIRLGIEIPEADLPPLLDRDAPGPATGGTVELLKVLLKIKCEQEGVASKLVASSADLDRIATDDDADVPAMHGWRREMFGLAALDLKHGRLAIAMKGNKIILIPVAGAS